MNIVGGLKLLLQNGVGSQLSYFEVTSVSHILDEKTFIGGEKVRVLKNSAQRRIQTLVVSRVQSETFNQVSHMLRPHQVSFIGLRGSNLDSILNDLKGKRVITVEVVGC